MAGCSGTPSSAAAATRGASTLAWRRSRPPSSCRWRTTTTTCFPSKRPGPGLYGLDALTGKRLWSSPADNVCGDKKDCDPGISAAITAIPGVVFAGHMDGRLRAYDSATGEVIWNFDTDREFETLSGAPGRGGSFGGGTGPVVVDGTLYANSGYGLYFHMPGNVLLAFSTDTEG